MKLFNSLDEIVNIDSTIIALGNFDGVHKGHQELISRTVKSAESTNLKSAIFTFSNHPRNVLASENGNANSVKSILYQDEKVEIIKNLGIDYMFSIPFDSYIQCISAVDFIDEILLKKLKMHEAYCGFNFKFGYKASGDVSVLMRESVKNQFGIHVLEPVKIDDTVVSSSLIREIVERGDVDKCMKFMGRHYAVDGEVVVGNKLGSKIGFPTSNIAVDEQMVSPANGVYITYCTYNDKKYPSITSVGVKPTIGEYKKNMETHIFNFDKELYGKTIRIEFIKKMRDEVKFDSIEELAKQITKDCVMAKDYHSKYSKVKNT
jgi:riboflavin kinase/FMN adenylyltransferase